MIKRRKQILVLFLLAVLLLSSVACRKSSKAQEIEKPSNDNSSTSDFGKTVPGIPNVLTPMIVVDNTVYYWTGEELTETPSEKEYSGYIESIVPENRRPTKSSESNLPCLNAPYIIVEDGVVLFYKQKWLLFRSANN
jgi:hypothetical protein